MLRLGSCLAVVGLVVGCGSTSSSNTPAAPLPFKASNVDITGWDLSKIGDVDLKGSSSCVVDAETPDGVVAWLCDVDFTNHVVHKIVPQSDGSKVSVWVMKSLRIEAGTSLLLQRGNLPVIIIATGSIDILGSIDVHAGNIGGSVNPMTPKLQGVGAGGGPSGDSGGLGAGGASYCGLGGRGGLSSQTGATTTQASPTAAFGSATITPLAGGSAGGSGGYGLGGAGGGAVQLVAGGGLNLRSGGFIKAAGGGGSFGGQALTDSAGGGGSGGAVLIESATVTLDGKISVNGGGGGQGNGDVGDDGTVEVIAKGGHKGGIDTQGGNGSFADAINGTDGTLAATIASSGGGGGAGRIRINTTSGAAAIGGTLSPPATTTCATQGKITPL